MSMALQAKVSPRSWAPRYLDQAQPLRFPVSETVPESQLHLELRTILYQLLTDALGGEFTVGSDQFVYYDAGDPTQVLAPDVYVRRAPSGELVRSWKVWERGAPEVAVEVVSESDARDRDWQGKLERYQHVGVQELVRFDAEATGQALRIWDRVEGTLLERQAEPDRAPSLVLELDWVVAPAERVSRALRIERNNTLVPTRTEARTAAEARVLELEAELAGRR